MDARYHRSSSYDSFYKQAANRPNLDVLHDAPVTQLVTETRHGKPKATGAIFMDEESGLIHQVKARKEVILSMGAFHSPQLLMVSVSSILLILDQVMLTAERELDLLHSCRSSESTPC